MLRVTQDPTAAARQTPGREEVAGEVGEVGEALEIEQKQLTFLGDEMLTMPVGGGATTTGAGMHPWIAPISYPFPPDSTAAALTVKLVTPEAGAAVDTQGKPKTCKSTSDIISIE